MATAMTMRPPSRRFRSLDIGRGVACVAVLLFHSTFYAREASLSTTLDSNQELNWADRIAQQLVEGTGWLYLGVPVFFVISGYCISASADEARRSSTGHLQFFLRRFRRIYPPFWICTAFGLCLVAGLEQGIPGLYADDLRPIAHPRQLTVWQWIGNLTLTESWRCQLLGDERRYFMGHAWTLCYEEQFYVVVGIALCVARRHLFPIMLALSGIVFVMVVAAPRWGIAERLYGFFFDGNWLMFAAGILVYFVLNYSHHRRACIGLRLLLALAFVYAVHHFPRVHFEFATAFVFAALLLVIHRWDTSIAGASYLSFFSRCGQICYSLYLVHWPICKGVSHGAALLGQSGPWSTLLFTIPLCSILSLGLGYGFHLAVERHFLNRPLDDNPR